MGAYKAVMNYHHQLPLSENTDSGQNSLLLVLLTDLDDTTENSLFHLCRRFVEDADINIHVWNPPKSILRSVSTQHSYRDSQANIYALAILAYRAKWTYFIVADELTKRQLCGSPRVGENPLVSAVMVATNQLESPAGKDEVRVVARRFFKSDSGDENLLQSLSSLQPGKVSPSLDYGEIYSSAGLVLHDPDRRPFAAGTVALQRERWIHTVHSALSGRYHLSLELVDNIVASATANESERRVRITSSLIPGMYSLNIFLLYPTTKGKASKLKQKFRNYISGQMRFREDELAVRIAPCWRHPDKATRRDLWGLFDQCRGSIAIHEICPALYFLLDPIEKVNGSTLIGSLYHDCVTPGNISWRPLDAIMHATCHWFSSHYPPEGLLETNYGLEWKDSKSTELMFAPDEPFYPIYRPWQMPWPLADDTAVIFYLTNNLSKEQDGTIRNFFQSVHTNLTAVGIAIRFVPWKNGDPAAPDGTVEDMWNAFWEYFVQESGPVFFIYAQSGTNLALSLAAPAYYDGGYDGPAEILKKVPLSNIRGMRYGRISDPDVAYNRWSQACIDLRAPMGILDSMFPRPDWPGHGILCDSD